MGTRSLTIFKDSDNGEIAVMYRQMDGYPSGHGQELAEFLSGMTMVNGISVFNPGKVANGMGDLAAQIVAHFKTDVGGIYLHPKGTRNCWEEYYYIITGKTGEEPHITCRVPRYSKDYEILGMGKTLFSGTASEMLAWIKQTQVAEV